MVKDIATVPQNYLPAWPFYPGPITEMEGIYYFRASDGVHGTELYRSDLTAAGTWMVKDICPGRCDGGPFFPRRMVVHQGYVYFQADDAIHGVELWRTDGTAGGTSLVADIAPGMDSSYPLTLTPVGSLLLFSANGGPGYRLWRTDGTAAGTVLVKPDWPVEYYLLVEGAVDNAAIVLAEAEDHGFELWRSDGTSEGTEFLTDVPQPTLSFDGDAPQRFFFQGSTAFFSGPDGFLWKSDGTPQGTVPVDSSAPKPGAAEWFTEMGGRVYFAASEPVTGREIWRTDGTESGTEIVTELIPGNGWSDPEQLISNGTLVFFTASTQAAGRELWASDGTAPGTQMVKDTAPGPDSLPGNGLRHAVASQNKLYFPANDNVHGQELWISDGTEANTAMILDIAPGVGSGFPSTGFGLRPAASPEGVFMFAFEPATGLEPWGSNGTAGGTLLIKDIDDQASSMRWYDPFAFVAGSQAGTVFFSADDSVHGGEPWASDGTAAGTQLLVDLKPNPPPYPSAIRGFARTGDRVIFPVPKDGLGFPSSQMWASDGSPGGTASVFDFPDDQYPWSFASTSELSFFHAEGGNGSGPLYRSDGTSDGSFVVAEDSDRPIAATADRLFFSRSQAPSNGLWLTDGTIPGTHLVSDLAASLSAATIMAAAGEQVFFAAEDPTAGYELWRSDGSAAGTWLVKDIHPGPDSFFWGGDFPNVASNEVLGFYPEWVGGSLHLYFQANDGSHGRELWSSDGTDGGTQLLSDIDSTSSSSESRWLTAVGDRAYFAADDDVSGRELWTSAGAPATTHQVADIVPGPGSSMPQSIAAVNDEAYFSAWTPGTGLELWRSNGTVAATVQVADINPGPGSSSPSSLTVSPPYLYFIASDGEHGFEPWALLVTSLALRPTMLGLDDTLDNANGLWEPGESVKLQPVWENLATSNITAVTGAGAGTNGAQCSDSTAAYGTFSPLDLRSCLSTGNCYAATLNGPRPSLHWEVTLHETLSTGKVHDWPIHIAASFDDVADDDGYADIEAFLHSNLTAGCSVTSFCPQDVVTRAQAALFLSLGLAGGSANLVPFTGNVPGKGAYDCTDGGASVFADVAPDDPFCRFVHDLAAREITGGCSEDSYCPQNPLSRAQLALLLGKALAKGPVPQGFSGPGGTYDCSLGTPSVHFTDVDENNPFCAATHYLWARQILSGCGATTFCPDGALVRATIASLLVDAFELQLP